MTDFNIIDSIKQADSKLSKSQRKIAEYITAHYDAAAYMTASRLGETVGVSESTVVRFATEISGISKSTQRAYQKQVDSCTTHGDYFIQNRG